MNDFKDDETRQFVEGLEKRASGANLIIEDSSGRLLAIKASYESYWGLPGGWIENDETAMEAVIRETKEELQLNILADDIEFVRLIDMRYSLGHIYISVFRLNRPLDGVQLVLPEEELEAYDWVTKEQILNNANSRAYSYAINLWARNDISPYHEFSQE